MSFYRFVLNGPVVNVIIPVLMGTMVLSLLAFGYATRGWRAAVLLIAFLCGAPYFEFVVKEAEHRIAGLAPLLFSTCPCRSELRAPPRISWADPFPICSN
jgi:hypothetical protein